MWWRTKNDNYEVCEQLTKAPDHQSSLDVARLALLQSPRSLASSPRSHPYIEKYIYVSLTCDNVTNEVSLLAHISCNIIKFNNGAHIPALW